jgi:hypothetical protein
LRKSVAVARSRLESSPRASILASTPIDGITSRAGVGSTVAVGSTVGWAARDGEDPAARCAGAGGVKNPIATKTPAAMTHPHAAALSLPLTSGRKF